MHLAQSGYVASYQGISSVCDGVIQLLRSNYDPDDFGMPLDFRVYTTSDFQKPMEAGVSLFLYRIYVNGDPRHPQGRLLPNGGRQKSLLPLDLHFFLTAWGKDASLQNALAGWMMRVMEDAPTLSAGLLNSARPGVFPSEESVEVVLADLTNEDMFRIWDALIQNSYRLSVPYLARSLRIESAIDSQPENPRVSRRDFAYHTPAD